jgi:hypothetical protein
LSNTRLAQIFEVNGQFVPTKASVYFKRIGANGSSYFDLSSAASIDATNFSSITQGTNKLIFDDRPRTYTGNGFMLCQNVGSSISAASYAYVTYPVAAGVSGKFWLYIRASAPSGVFKATIMIDGVNVASINQVMFGTGWTWVSANIVLPDTNSYDLSIRLEEHDNAIDKLYISDSSTSVSGNGPALTEAPYVTSHLQVYEVDDNFFPTTPLFIYDYKTTLEEITTDDWYNFSLVPMESGVIVFGDIYALVMSSSGDSSGNHIIWEMVDNDEYQTMPSGIRYRE